MNRKWRVSILLLVSICLIGCTSCSRQSKGSTKVGVSIDKVDEMTKKVNKETKRYICWCDYS